MRNSLLKKLYKAQQGVINNSKIVIGLIGTSRGVGTTHSSLLITSYFSTWLNKKTCYIEYGSREQVESMCQFYNMEPAKEDISLYHYEGVDYYGGVTQHKLSTILGSGYQCIVIDFGCDLIRANSELIRCDRKILVTNLNPWRIYELKRYVENGMWDFEGSKDVIVPLTSKKYIEWIKVNDKDSLKTIKNTRLTQIPFEENPFVISELSLKILNKMFHIHN